MISITKKYVAGMTAAATAAQVTLDDYNHDEFAKGVYDAQIIHVRQPSITGRFWPWVKEADAKREEEEKNKAQKQLDEDAAAAEKQALEAMQAAQVTQHEVTVAETAIAIENQLRVTASLEGLSDRCGVSTINCG